MKVDVRDIVSREVEIPDVCPECGADFSDPEESNLRIHQLETTSQRGWLAGCPPMEKRHIEYDEVIGTNHGGEVLSAGYQCAMCDHVLVAGLQS